MPNFCVFILCIVWSVFEADCRDVYTALFLLLSLSDAPLFTMRSEVHWSRRLQFFLRSFPSMLMDHRLERSHWGVLWLSLSLVRTKVGTIWDLGNKIVISTKVKLPYHLKCDVYKTEDRIKGESSVAGHWKPPSRLAMGLVSSSL